MLIGKCVFLNHDFGDCSLPYIPCEVFVPTRILTPGFNGRDQFDSKKPAEQNGAPPARVGCSHIPHP